MKKHVLYVSAVISVLSMAGCSRFEDTTSVGSDVLNNIDPSFLDNAKNYTPFDLDSSVIVSSAFSVPDENDTNYGIHVPALNNQKPREAYFPVGGKNGEVTTAYYEFETSLNNWNKVNGVDSLKQHFKVYSTVLQFDTVNSGRADCNYNQKVHIFRVKDSTWKYNRNESNVKKLFQNKQLFDTLLNISNLSQELFDTAFNNDIFRSVTDSPYKPHTFQFVVASEDTNNNYAFLKNKATLKVHMKRGEPRKSGSVTSKDAMLPDTIKTLPDIESSSNLWRLTVKPNNDTLKKIDTLTSIKTISVTIFDTTMNLYDTLVTDTTIVTDLQPPIRRRIKSKDTTLVVDSIVSITKATRIETFVDTLVRRKTTSVTQIDSVLDSIVHSADTTFYVCKTLQFSIDTIRETPKVKKYTITDRCIEITIDTTVMKADSLTIPIVYGNNIAYETGATLASRKNDPISSYGPRRTAVFELNLDSLWKKLKEPATATHPAFNKILSAGVAITGKHDSTFMTDLTDTTITVSWCVSEIRYTNGRELFKGDKSWGIRTITPGMETVLPIEKNLQEILSRSVNPPAKVYLHLEIQTSKHFEKQVIWSKPSLISVLTTSK